MFNSKYIIIALSLVVIASCKKKEDPDPANPTTPAKVGNVEMHFDNVVGSEDLALNTATYKNSMGDDYQVTKFNYYISNITFNAETGAGYSEPESYHLVEEEKAASTRFMVSNVHGGKYKSVTFTIGVDSLRNVSGAQTGALDVNNGMFWSWNSGYIMMKIEGNAAKAPTGKLIYHVGGFSGANNTVKTVTLTFPEAISIDATNYHIHIKADLAKALSSPNVMDFATTHTIHMPGANAVKIADNYAGMFSIHEVEKQ